MNIPVTGGGSNVGRTRSVEISLKEAAVSPIPTNINKVADLKRAELTGDGRYSISDEQLVKAIEKAIQAMQGKSTMLEFSVHEKTKTISVKILDSNTGEVIKEVPPEKTLDFVAKLWEMAGLIVDEKR